MPGLRGAWRSLVAHLLWEQGVGGSNPLAPTARAGGIKRISAKPPRGCSSTVEPQPSKLVMGVRFPSPALAPSGQEDEPHRHRLAVRLPFASVSGRNHSETCAGCIVLLTTATRSSLRASRSVSWLSVAEKASRVFLASYFLR